MYTKYSKITTKYRASDYLWLIILSVNFLLWHPFIQMSYNAIRQLSVALSILALIQFPSIFKKNAFIYALVLLTPLVPLLLFYLQGSGGFRLEQECKFYAYSLPYYVLGFRFASNGLRELRFLFIAVVLAGTTIMAFFVLLRLFGTFHFNASRYAVAIAMYGNPDPNNLILTLPTISMVALISSTLYGMNKIRATIIVIVCQLILLVLLLSSTFSGSVVIFIGGLIIMFVLRTQSTRKIFWPLTATVTVLLLFNLFVSNQSDYALGSLNLGTIISDVSSGQNDLEAYFNKLTHGRVDLAMLSIKTFLSNPLMGDGFNGSLGGHSFIFDSLAAMGIIGSAPIFVMYLFWIVTGFRNGKYLSFDWSNTACLTVIFGIFVFSTFNPYLLHSAIDFLVFYCAGLLCGDNYVLNKKRRNERKTFSMNDFQFGKVRH
jgi:hypothetical protein